MECNILVKTYKFLIAVAATIVSLSASSQNLALSCKGKQLLISRLGVSEIIENETYEFRNWKLYGVYDATWNNESIRVDFPQNLKINNSIILTRTIIIDRNNGSILDTSESIINESLKTDEMARSIFKGVCEIARKKF